jgi:hypothetical protein
VYLAGDIVGDEDWQAQAGAQLADAGAVVLNPRQPGVPDNGLTKASRAARGCQHRRLPALVMLFWFPRTDPAAVAVTALLELGAELIRRRSPQRRPVIGAAPGYPCRGEILLHIANERPDLVVHHTLDQVIAAAIQELAALGAGRRTRTAPVRLRWASAPGRAPNRAGPGLGESSTAVSRYRRYR